MYLAITSAPNPDSLTSLDASLQTSAASPGVSAGLSGYMAESMRKRLQTFYPPPYGFAAGMSGHDCGCGGSCGGCGNGMGDLFDSGTDISGWGWPEWLLVAGGAFVVVNALGSVASAGKSVRRSVGGYQRRAKKRAALKSQLSDTGWF